LVQAGRPRFTVFPLRDHAARAPSFAAFAKGVKSHHPPCHIGFFFMKHVSVELPESAWSPTAAPGSFDSRAYTRTSLRMTEGESIAETAERACETVAYIQSMPGGTRFGHPRSPVTISALIVLLIVLIWVIFSRLGWLP
jgi:hypothetical protein